jgi:hypothetical protein
LFTNTNSSELELPQPNIKRGSRKQNKHNEIFRTSLQLSGKCGGEYAAGGFLASALLDEESSGLRKKSAQSKPTEDKDIQNDSAAARVL